MVCFSFCCRRRRFASYTFYVCEMCCSSSELWSEAPWLRPESPLHSNNMNKNYYYYYHFNHNNDHCVNSLCRSIRPSLLSSSFFRIVAVETLRHVMFHRIVFRRKILWHNYFVFFFFFIWLSNMFRYKSNRWR